MDLLIEPGAGVSPPTLGSGPGNAKDGCSLFDGEAGEVAEFDEFGFIFVERGEFFQGVADGEKFLIRRRSDNFEFVDIDALLIAAVAEGAFAAGAFYENPAHRFGGGTEKVGAVLPRLLIGGDQAEPGFMYEGGGLKSVAGRFVRHSVGREFAQFVVDERKQFISGFGLTALDRSKNVSDIAHLVCPGESPSISALACCMNRRALN